jgi:hypothetical protein
MARAGSHAHCFPFSATISTCFRRRFLHTINLAQDSAITVMYLASWLDAKPQQGSLLGINAQMLCDYVIVGP